MAKWIMTIDIEKCENCNNCFLACKDEHYDNHWRPYTLAQPRHGHRWMNIRKKERGTFPHIGVAYMPRPCFHCADPPCVKTAAAGEIYQRPDGIVFVDPEKSKGRKELAAACPHGSIWWNDKHQTPQKCTLCAHLLDGGWRQPRCVQACPTGALSFGKLPDEEFREKMPSFEGLETSEGLAPGDTDRAPVVMYKNLSLFSTCFIAGSVATGRDSVQDCVADLEVSLFLNGTLIGRNITDAFGDFRFTGLGEDRGDYELRLIRPDGTPLKKQVALPADCAVGTIWI